MAPPVKHVDDRMDPALSVYFDLVRFGAALIVVLNHYGVLLSFAQSSTFPGSDAVIVFFVLSGYVIAYVSDRPGLRADRYAMDRLSRLWSVAVPATGLALVLGLGYLWFGIQPVRFRADNLRGLIVSSAVNIGFLGESWHETFAPYNFPFWSVNYEAWYYIIFGLWIFLRGWKKVVSILVACLLSGPSILVFMPIWLLGAALYRYRINLKTSNALANVVFILSVVGYSTIYHFNFNKISRIWLKNITHGESYHLGPSTSIFCAYMIALFVAANFIAVANMRLLKITLPAIGGFARKISSYTLTIYLFHVPLLFSFYFVGVGRNGVINKIVLCLLSAAAIVILAPFTEHKRLVWRDGMMKILAFSGRIHSWHPHSGPRCRTVDKLELDSKCSSLKEQE